MARRAGVRQHLAVARTVGRAVGLGAVGLGAVDLGAVDLGAVDLGAVDLSAVDLGAVDLGAVDLSAVDLSAVDLSAVDLSAVDLSAVDLSAVDLGPVDLGPVDLGPVDLGPVDLSAVDLSAVDLGLRLGALVAGLVVGLLAADQGVQRALPQPRRGARVVEDVEAAAAIAGEEAAEQVRRRSVRTAAGGVVGRLLAQHRVDRTLPQPRRGAGVVQQSDAVAGQRAVVVAGGVVRGLAVVEPVDRALPQPRQRADVVAHVEAVTVSGAVTVAGDVRGLLALDEHVRRALPEPREGAGAVEHVDAVAVGGLLGVADHVVGGLVLDATVGRTLPEPGRRAGVVEDVDAVAVRVGTVVQDIDAIADGDAGVAVAGLVEGLLATDEDVERALPQPGQCAQAVADLDVTETEGVEQAVGLFDAGDLIGELNPLTLLGRGRRNAQSETGGERSAGHNGATQHCLQHNSPQIIRKVFTRQPVFWVPAREYIQPPDQRCQGTLQKVNLLGDIPVTPIP
ncbi:pentapeptide repeat-containing protein [Jiangella endophytica]|uniref:pentapeptide repeat-containing protein n=1 Tax=Jiangella endophytica TaxID=1623398 RepID=UPI0038CC08CB